jgi:hypothetical protein
MYGVSNVFFPISYTYIIQTVTIVNTSTIATTPSFNSFISVNGY